MTFPGVSPSAPAGRSGGRAVRHSALLRPCGHLPAVGRLPSLTQRPPPPHATARNTPSAPARLTLRPSPTPRYVRSLVPVGRSFPRYACRATVAAFSQPPLPQGTLSGHPHPRRPSLPLPPAPRLRSLWLLPLVAPAAHSERAASVVPAPPRAPPTAPPASPHARPPHGATSPICKVAASLRSAPLPLPQARLLPPLPTPHRAPHRQPPMPVLFGDTAARHPSARKRRPGHAPPPARPPRQRPEKGRSLPHPPNAQQGALRACSALRPTRSRLVTHTPPAARQRPQKAHPSLPIALMLGASQRKKSAAPPLD